MGIYANDVQKLYIAYFNRPADPVGLAYWEEQITKNGGSTAAVANAFSASAEYKALYDGKASAAIVDAIYQNLFGRSAEADGLVYWGVRLENGTFNVGNIAMSIMIGAQNDDKKVIENKVVVATAFTAALDTSAEILAYSGTAAADAARNFLKTVAATDASLTAAKAAVATTVANIAGTTVANGTTFTLTNGTDTFTGTAKNDTFNAPATVVIDTTDGTSAIVDSLQNVDSIVGGDGTDTLNVTIGNAGTNAMPTVSGVEDVVARFTAAGILDLAAASGVSSIKVANSTAASRVDNIGAVNDLRVAGISTAAAVSFDGSTATTLGIAADTVGKVSATAAVEVAIDIGRAVASKATTLNVAVTNSNIEIKDTAGANVATTATIAATGTNEVKLTDGLALTSLTVTGTGSVDVSEVGLVKVATLTAGDGGVTFDTGDSTATTFTATTGAGKDTLKVDGANVKSVSTGAGNDSVTTAVAALAATATVDLGAGDDTLTLGTAFSAGATLTAGEGTDTLAMAKADYATITGGGAYTDAVLAKVTGFEVLSLTDALTTGTYDVSKIAGIGSFTAAAGVTAANTATIDKLAAGATVTLAGDLSAATGALVANLKDATGTTDTLNLVIKSTYTDNNDTAIDAVARTATVTASGVETLNVNSTGKINTFTPVSGYKADLVTNTLALTDTALVTLNVTGDQAISFTSAGAMVKLATVDASANTGGATVNVSAAATDGTAAAITIKGSATAANVLTGSGNADTIVGGAKADTITGGAGADTMTGAAGNDTFAYTAAVQSTLAKLDVITDFSANTYGNGTNGAAGTGAGADTTKWTGDIISFDVDTAAFTKVAVSVQTSAADAQVFLQNTADATADTIGVALDSATSKLYIDWTSDGTVDSVIQLTGVTTVTAAAFLLV